MKPKGEIRFGEELTRWGQTVRSAGTSGPAIGWVTLFLLVPLIVIGVLSFMSFSETGVAGMPFTVDNYKRLIGFGEFGFEWKTYPLIMARSILLGIGTAILCLAAGLPLAFFVAGLSPRGKNAALTLIMIPFWTNLLIRTYAWQILLSPSSWVSIVAKDGSAMLLAGWENHRTLAMLFWFAVFVALTQRDFIYSARALMQRLAGKRAKDWWAVRHVFERMTAASGVLGVLVCLWWGYIAGWAGGSAAKSWLVWAAQSDGLYPGAFAVYIGMVCDYLPFMVLPLYSSVEKIDWTLSEAAADLGANAMQRFRHAVLPQIVPGLVAGVILVLIPAMGQFVIPDLLGGSKTVMLGNAISQQFGPSRDWPFGSAIAFLGMGSVMIGLWIYARYVGEKGGNIL